MAITPVQFGSGVPMDLQGETMSAKKKTSWVNIVAFVLMLGALFAYVATLDEADPEALPNAVNQVEGP